MNEEQKENRIITGIAPTFREAAGAIGIAITPMVVGMGLIFGGSFYLPDDLRGSPGDWFLTGGGLGFATTMLTTVSCINFYRKFIINPLREERDCLKAELKDMKVELEALEAANPSNSNIQTCSRYADVPKAEPGN